MTISWKRGRTILKEKILMSNTVELGNVKLGMGRMPAVCVPILAGGFSEVVHQAEAIQDSPADLTEFRADYMDESSFINAYTLKKTMEAVRRILPARPMIFTLRTAAEGGEAAVEDRDYELVCSQAVESGFAEAVDVEFSRDPEVVARLIEHAHSHGVRVIVSSHDFSSTPDASAMVEKMTAMEKTGADIVKMAVMPQDDSHVAEVFRASEHLKASLNVPFIMISMGEKGAMTRFAGEQSGSVLTFGTAGRSSAPGQVRADDLDRALRIIHNSRRPFPEKWTEDAQNIILGGFMGAGKTSTAEKIAGYSELEVVEMDAMIEEREGMSIPEIFEKYGEDYFRKAEEAVCREISGRSGVVVSTGGGTLMRKSNVSLLRKNGVIFVMEASPDVILDRLIRSDTERPLLKDHMNRGYISWLMKQRQEAYEEAADICLDVSHMTPGAAAVKILSLAGFIPG